MKVRAKLKGVYGSRRWKPGEEFEVDDHNFNASWMQAVEEAPAKKKPGRPKKQPKEDKPSASEQTEV
tara:strand:+ start:1201 stop:1401 length:201 start_codon:yes stop_codon:yes gene_type:complete